MLNGLKTYLVAAAAVLAALVAYVSGELTGLQFFEALGLAVALSGNRAVVRSAEILKNRMKPRDPVDPFARMVTVYGGAALTIITAIIGATSGAQDTATTMAAIFAALGLNFLGLGAKKAATA